MHDHHGHAATVVEQKVVAREREALDRTSSSSTTATSSTW